MLKQLVQLFAEKFLTNKKEWVGSNAFPALSPTILARGPTALPSNTAVSSFVAPYDGYISAQVSAKSPSVKGVWIEYAGMRLWQGAIEGTWAGGIVPVKKGTAFTVTFRYESVQNTDFPVVEFYPSVGSQN